MPDEAGGAAMSAFTTYILPSGLIYFNGPEASYGAAERYGVASHSGNITFALRAGLMGGDLNNIGIRSNSDRSYVAFGANTSGTYLINLRSGAGSVSFAQVAGSAPDASGNDTIIGVLSGTTFTAYKNGSLVGSATLSGASSTPNLTGGSYVEFVGSRFQSGVTGGTTSIARGYYAGGFIITGAKSASDVTAMHNWLINNTLP